MEAECAVGILNAPDPSFNPGTDKALVTALRSQRITRPGKRTTSWCFRNMVGLIQDPDAPVFFWPSRLDRFRKAASCWRKFYTMVSTYWDKNLQIIFVANGEFKGHFTNIVRFHDLHKRVACGGFS